MRKMFLLILLLSVFISPGLSGEITSFSEAKAAAQEQNKPLLIDFMTTW